MELCSIQNIPIQQSWSQLALDKEFNNWNIRRLFGVVLLECNVDVLLNRSCLSWYVIGPHNFGTNV